MKLKLFCVSRGYLRFEARSQICKRNCYFRHVHLSFCPSTLLPLVRSAGTERMKFDTCIFRNIKIIRVIKIGQE